MKALLFLVILVPCLMADYTLDLTFYTADQKNAATLNTIYGSLESDGSLLVN